MKYSRRTAFLFLTIALLLSAVQTVAAKDTWTEVRSKNFLLVGNASEKDIRKVATRLEQFRESFRLLFAKVKLSSSIPTNVIVFKNEGAYKNFKPKRADGKIDNFIAGYFQPGEDVNYITLSMEGEDRQTFAVIFHEYVHSILNTNFGKSTIPPWFNEGLAEYYSTLEVVDGQKIKLGLPLSSHLSLLQEQRLIPLSQLFAITNFQLHQQGDHSRNIFYAESWALIHYLTHTDKADELNTFFNAIIRGTAPEKAFQDVFKTTYDKMEGELRKYVAKSTFNYSELTLKNKMTVDSDMTATQIDDADSNAYLGDLLYHTNRADDAEPYLTNALAAKPASSMANTAMGMVKFKQRKFADARKYLETAIADDGKSYIAFYRYAYLLSREGQDEFGMIGPPPTESVEKMRAALAKAIELNPSFTESYELLAFIDLVSQSHLDEAVDGLMTALKYQPGNQRYALRIAEIYSSQNKLADAETIAKKISETTDDASTKSRAESLLNNISQRRMYETQVEEQRKATAERLERAQSGNNQWGDPVDPNDPDGLIRSINEALRRPAPEEKRVVGVIQKIDCRQRPLAYTVKTPVETFTLTSVDFQALDVGAYAAGADQAQIGCEENISRFNAVITYKPQSQAKSLSRGELVAVEFVPANFRFLDAPPPRLVKRSEEDFNGSSVTGTMMEPPPGRTEEETAMRRRMMMQGIRNALPKPAAGQKQDIGFLDKVECSNKGIFFVIRTTAKTYRLLNSSPQSLRIGVFSPDLAGMQFGCTVKPIDVPAVFNYVVKPDAKLKSDGEIVALTFVPKGFTLEQ